MTSDYYSMRLQNVCVLADFSIDWPSPLDKQWYPLNETYEVGGARILSILLYFLKNPFESKEILVWGYIVGRER